MKPKTAQIVSYAVAKEGRLLPGGVKKWQSAPQDNRETAKAILAAYLDGFEDAVSYSGTREANGETLPRI